MTAAGLAAVAVVAFALFLLFGTFAVARTRNAFDGFAVRVAGHALPPAIAFTRSGRAPFLLASSIAATLAFLIAGKSAWIPVAMIVSQTVSQGAVELLKRVFRRARPDHWLVGLELGYSYPSGHAATAVVYYGGWAVLAEFSHLGDVAKTAIVAVLVCWALGIMWSRLALGAHYATDVAGGALFGAAWIAALGAAIHFYEALYPR